MHLIDCQRVACLRLCFFSLIVFLTPWFSLHVSFLVFHESTVHMFLSLFHNSTCFFPSSLSLCMFLCLLSILCPNMDALELFFTGVFIKPYLAISAFSSGSRRPAVSTHSNHCPWSLLLTVATWSHACMGACKGCHSHSRTPLGGLEGCCHTKLIYMTPR
jgi:hypothetical protein